MRWKWWRGDLGNFPNLLKEDVERNCFDTRSLSRLLLLLLLALALGGLRPHRLSTLPFVRNHSKKHSPPSSLN